jgi:hypothetical protein
MKATECPVQAMAGSEIATAVELPRVTKKIDEGYLATAAACTRDHSNRISERKDECCKQFEEVEVILDEKDRLIGDLQKQLEKFNSKSAPSGRAYDNNWGNAEELNGIGEVAKERNSNEMKKVDHGEGKGQATIAKGVNAKLLGKFEQFLESPEIERIRYDGEAETEAKMMKVMLSKMGTVSGKGSTIADDSRHNIPRKKQHAVKKAAKEPSTKNKSKNKNPGAEEAKETAIGQTMDSNGKDRRRLGQEKSGASTRNSDDTRAAKRHERKGGRAGIISKGHKAQSTKGREKHINLGFGTLHVRK